MTQLLVSLHRRGSADANTAKMRTHGADEADGERAGTPIDRQADWGNCNDSLGPNSSAKWQPRLVRHACLLLLSVVHIRMCVCRRDGCSMRVEGSRCRTATVRPLLPPEASGAGTFPEALASPCLSQIQLKIAVRGLGIVPCFNPSKVVERGHGAARLNCQRYLWGCWSNVVTLFCRRGGPARRPQG